jgi:hypothetical protein
LTRGNRESTIAIGVENMRDDEAMHLDMMRHPERWSAMGGFILPLQHRTRKEPDQPGMNLLGFMFEDTEKRQARPRVYVGCMYFLDGKNLDTFPTEEYSDLEAVVRAGWEVN